MEANAFAIGEVVVVKRSNGSFCFAKIEKFNAKSGSYDVSLDSGDAKNPTASSMKTGLIPKHLGKIVSDPNRIVIIPGLELKDSLTEQTATVLNNAQAFAHSLRAREVTPLHLAIYFLERNKWCLNFVQKTGLESPRLLQVLKNKAISQATTSSIANVPVSTEVGASQNLNYVMSQAKQGGSGSVIEIPQVLFGCSHTYY